MSGLVVHDANEDLFEVGLAYLDILYATSRLAQTGEQDLVTDRWVGLMRRTRQPKPSPEDSSFPTMVAAPVRACASSSSASIASIAATST